LAQAALVVAGPVVFGAICGVLLGASEAAYLLAIVLSLFGGFLAGFEHPGSREGAIRGLVGGSLFGASILIAHEIEGSRATADLPHPGVLLVLLSAAVGAALGALGGYLRGRSERAEAAP
jgi:hypothetical protein